MASSVACLSILATADPNSVPDYVFLHDDHKPVEEQAQLLEQISEKKYEVEAIDVVKLKEGVLAENFTGWLRLSVGQGQGFTRKRRGGLVDSGESLLKWATFKTFLTETYEKD